ncbi:hypothetical protein SAMN04488029_1185 [Reichenbachiella faecimaris]|uniref:Uncharacterized protein n=1 Tax=Reichenbachiella faecimaris TaxID=692418 RepID=A0A1W2G820_REIFA|nr:hypothetical protein SAMN04488029_1185 [Reichenbachiella faecimaris]
MIEENVVSIAIGQGLFLVVTLWILRDIKVLIVQFVTIRKKGK